MERRIERRHLAGVGTLVIALGVLLFFVLRNTALAGGAASIYLENANVAYAEWYEDSVEGYVWVAQSGNQPQGQSFLYYTMYFANPCCSLEYGTGQIPNSDVKVSNANPPMLQLNTNTCANPDFYTSSGKCGIVQVNWQKNGLYAARNSGSYAMDFGVSRWLFNGAYSSVSASASGKVFDSILVGSGEMGTYQNASISVQPK